MAAPNLRWWTNLDPSRRDDVQRFVAEAARDCMAKFQLTETQYQWVVQHLTTHRPGSGEDSEDEGGSRGVAVAKPAENEGDEAPAARNPPRGPFPGREDLPGPDYPKKAIQLLETKLRKMEQDKDRAHRDMKTLKWLTLALCVVPKEGGLPVRSTNALTNMEDALEKFIKAYPEIGTRAHTQHKRD